MGSEYKELLIATINPIAYIFMILIMRNLENDANDGTNDCRDQ